MAALIALPLSFGAIAPAFADNPMGYQLLSEQEASQLPKQHGALGLDVARAQQIADSGMVFDILRVQQVRPHSPGAQAGLRAGDQIIAVDGRVFPTIAAFAAYIGSRSPGSRGVVDYMPAGSGPAQAQRVGVTFGGLAGPGQPTMAPSGPPSGPSSGPPSAPSSPEQASTGMSTGTKLAIGAGAAALLCYKMGCFSHRTPAVP